MNPAPGAKKAETRGLEKETVMELEVLSKHTTASTWCVSGLMPFSRVTRPRNKGGERAAPSDVPRYSSIIMVPSITFVGIFFHTDISIKSSQNQVPAMFEVTNNI